ncbi:MAG: LD-carboxypeptidase [Legionellales bacterium]|nr:LD-carboxypeptidase [Legionellales bacterium]
MTTILNPYSLTQGNKIGLVAPASCTLRREDAKHVSEILKNRYGIECVYDDHVFQPKSPQYRAAILRDYMLASDIQMIWPLRGGEGSADLIPYLQPLRDQLMHAPKKLLMGFSDITALLIYFTQQLDWPVVHGYGAAALLKPELDQTALEISLDFIFGKQQQIVINSLIPLNSLAKTSPPITAKLIGGNLSLLNISIADCWQLDGRDKIVIIEDVSERAYRTSRTLKYFQRINLFNSVKALIFGYFFDVFPVDNQIIEEETNNRYLRYFAEQCDFPVWQCDKIGHGKTNLPLPFYCDANLQSDQLVISAD